MVMTAFFIIMMRESLLTTEVAKVAEGEGLKYSLGRIEYSSHFEGCQIEPATSTFYRLRRDHPWPSLML